MKENCNFIVKRKEEEKEMDKKRKVNTNRVAAYALSGVMLASMVPYNVFASPEKTQSAISAAAAGSGLEMAPAKGPVAVANAAEPEDTATSADAKDAVHGFVGVLVGGDVNADLKEETGQRFKPIEGVKVYFQWFEKKEIEHHQLIMQFQELMDSSILR